MDDFLIEADYRGGIKRMTVLTTMTIELDIIQLTFKEQVFCGISDCNFKREL